MDLKNWLMQKRTSVPNKLDYKFIFKNVVSLIFYSSMIVLFCALALLAHAAFTYSVYSIYAVDHIDAYLDKTSETILLKSSDNIEIVQNIVEWERNEYVLSSKRFKIPNFFLRHASNNPGWYLFLNKGNCGEFAIVFEDMANRSGVTSRQISVNGFIDFQGNRSNHAWSEVLINETEWYVADSGFNYSPPVNHFLDYSKFWMLGPVYAFENGIQIEDRTTYYIPNTETIIIKSTYEGEIVPNSSIKIEMNHNGTSQSVIGTTIKLETNESGLCPVTLGVYNNTSYTIKVIDGIYQGKKEIVLGNNTGYVEVEIEKLNSLSVISFLLLIVFNIIIWRSLLRKRFDKKEKHEKL